MNGLRHLQIFLVIILSIFSHLALASLPTDPCKEVVVIADTNWAPYSYQSGGEVRGAAVDIVKKIFAEIDLPVKVLAFEHPRLVRHALLLGDADVIITLYDHPESDEFVDVIQPGFNVDPITVLMRKNRAATVENWHDLIGMRGIATEYFSFDRHFVPFKEKYLFVKNSGNLADSLTRLSKSKIDYIIGSRHQLDYALEQLAMSDDIVLVGELEYPANVHMGYSRTSACHHYRPYLKQRLDELSKTGTIQDYLVSYLNDVDFDSEN